MVVPVERTSTPRKIRKYVGNDLNLNIIENNRILIITGNNCKIKLSENSGIIKVIGDYCDITILKGNGNIEYIGNYGKIKLGLEMSEDAVTYIGNGGEISTKGQVAQRGMESLNMVSRSGSKTKSDKNRIDISNVSKIRYSTPFPSNIAHIHNNQRNKHFEIKYGNT